MHTIQIKDVPQFVILHYVNNSGLAGKEQYLMYSADLFKLRVSLLWRIQPVS